MIHQGSFAMSMDAIYGPKIPTKSKLLVKVNGSYSTSFAFMQNPNIDMWPPYQLGIY